MTRTISRRLRRLETQVGLAVVPPNSHVICFVTVDMRVASKLEMANGRWTHFDPPRERAEFEPTA